MEFNLFKDRPSNSFKDVFPELPVIAIEFIFETFLKFLAIFKKKLKVFLTFIFLSLNFFV